MNLLLYLVFAGAFAIQGYPILLHQFDKHISSLVIWLFADGFCCLSNFSGMDLYASCQQHAIVWVDILINIVRRRILFIKISSLSEFVLLKFMKAKLIYGAHRS